MTKVFDGQSAASKKILDLGKSVEELRDKGITPKLVSIMIGNNKLSSKYLSLKKTAAKALGVKMVVKTFSANTKASKIIDTIARFNNDNSIHGVMLQLPFPKKLKSKTDSIISSILPSKDVDGMRNDSLFLAPVIKAVIVAFKQSVDVFASKQSEEIGYTVVVGARGFVGSRLTRVLKEMGFEVRGIDVGIKNLRKITRSADVLISATGQAYIIKNNMVKKGAVVIDVGAPNGDVDFERVAKKTSFITPVPGGIGPLTIACLLENLVEAASG